jgi:hypothetical protein
MKKRSMVFIIVLTFALLLSSFTAASAQPNASAPIECVVDITNYFDLDVGYYWLGSVTGCMLKGTVLFVETDQNFDAGKSGHFFETFTIWPESGGEIRGENAGVWNFSTFKFRANGRVTGASEEWADLVGYKFHEMGRTTDPFDPEADVVSAPGTIMTLH